MDTASHAPGQNLLGGDAQTLRPNSVRPVSLAHLREHLQGLGAQVSSQPANGVQSSESVEVTGISMDTRGVRPQDLYVALPGAKVHGAQFAEAALKLGASAILTDAAGAQLLGEAPVPGDGEPPRVRGSVGCADLWFGVVPRHSPLCCDRYER